MFGLGGLKEKMEQAKERAKETKERMNTVYVDGKAAQGKVKVICTANRKVKDVVVDPSLLAEGDAEQLNDLLVLAMNEALEKAERIFETEMAAVAKDAMPNIPGMGNLQELLK